MELTYKWIALANRHYLMYLNKRLASYGLSGSQYLFILNICRQPGLTQDKLPDIMKENIVLLNKDLPAYSQIADFEIMEQEFEKTPKRSIRRFLYK